MQQRFRIVDVFHDEATLSGNALGAVCDADGLATDEMQRLARWLNLSETTFLLPPTDARADYRVRIFTLARELPFAGHPTLGSCHAWLAEGGRPRRDGVIMQECGVGLVPIRRDAARLAFAAPPLIRSGEVAADTLDAVIRFLGVARFEVAAAQWADNGPGWIVVLLRSAEAVLTLDPPKAHPTRIDVGVVGPYPPGHAAAFEVRAFFSDHTGGVVEDPVTGSLNAAVAQWLLSSGRATAPYIASQGTRLGRCGRIFVSQDETGAVWIGGRTTSHVVGTCDVEAASA